MKLVDIKVGNNTYNVLVADDDKSRKQGLRNKESLDSNKGMLFIWDEPQDVSMTMDETKIPLDLIFIDEEMNVFAVHHREDVETNKLIAEPDTLMVLELNLNSDVKVGDEVEIIDDTEDGKYVMRVLAPDGSALVLLLGGERIFSRKNSIVLIRLAKRANISKEDRDYKRLGKSVFKYLDVLESNEPEYVTLPS